MICTKCNTDAVQNTVLGKVFYYCRTCKDEVIPEYNDDLFFGPKPENEFEKLLQQSRRQLNDSVSKSGLTQEQIDHLLSSMPDTAT